MPVEPINLTSVIAVIMGISVVLVPVIGLTARFALKPAVETLTKLVETRGTEESVQILERRIGLLETHLETLESSVHRLEETVRFDAQLRGKSTEATGQLPTP
jgi:hypothetical protein